MLRRTALVVVACLVAAGVYFFEIPLEWGMSDEDVTAAARRGRQIFLTNCATCHRGESDLPTQAELQQDYSQRELSQTLVTPPEGMPPFTGTAEEHRDLILFLTQG